MPLTEQQLAERRKYIGASDVAAILGYSKWATAYDVWAFKTGRVDLVPSSEAARIGTALESGVLELAEAELGPLECGIHAQSPDYPIIHANLDARVTETGEPVEAKTSSMLDGWGEPGTDAVPDLYIIQCQIQMHCTGATVCHVAALFADRGFRFGLYRVPRVQTLIDMATEKAAAFWNDYVLTDTPPPDSVPSYEIVKAMRREPGRVATVADELLTEWRAAKDILTQADRAEYEKRAALLAAIGDAEAAVTPTAGGITYFEQSRKEHMVKASTFRVLRYRQPKGEES